MPNDSSPLFWIVLFTLFILTVVAYRAWRVAWNKLDGQELRAVNRISAEPVPQNMEAAVALLPSGSTSVVVAALRQALQTGTVQTNALEFYDWIQLPRYLAGVFVFIGLLGTILGIAVSVSSLGAAVSNSTAASDQLSDISRHIFDLLSGMKYAFYCTIGGLVATLVISALNASYLSRCRHVEMRTESLAYRFFIPIYAASLEQTKSEGLTMPEMLSTLQDTVKDLSDATEKFSKSVVPVAHAFQQTANGTANLSDTLLSAGAVLREDLLKSAERSETIRKTLEFAGDGFRKTFEDLADIASNLEGAATQLANERTGLTSTVKDAALEMSGSVRKLQETLTESARLQENQLDQLMSQSTANQKKMGELLRQFEITLADVTAVTEQSTLRQDVQRLIEQLQVLQQAASRSSPQHEMAAMRADVALLGKAVQGVETQFGTVGAQIGEVSKRTQKLDGSVSNLTDQFTLLRRQVGAIEDAQNAPVVKRIPRVFQKDYWV